MFYFKEFFFRLKYLIINIFIIGLICYYYKEDLFLIFNIFIINPISLSTKLYNLNYFIYTHPIEYLNILFLLIIFFLHIYIIPLFI